MSTNRSTLHPVSCQAEQVQSPFLAPRNPAPPDTLFEKKLQVLVELCDQMSKNATVVNHEAFQAVAISLSGAPRPEHLRSARLDFPFHGLFGRKLHGIDCRGLFCELDKYCREAVPELTSARSRIKANISALAGIPPLHRPAARVTLPKKKPASFGARCVI